MKSDFLVIDRIINAQTLKKEPPAKPPRAFKPLHVKQSVESENSETNLQKTTSTNNVHCESFVNDDYTRLYYVTI